MNKRMMMVVSMVLALSLMLGGATFAQDTDEGATTLVANLTGPAERTPAGGDPDGTGTATVTITPATGQVCWEIAFMGIDQPSASHIHRGTADVAGPVVVPLC